MFLKLQAFCPSLFPAPPTYLSPSPFPLTEGYVYWLRGREIYMKEKHQARAPTKNWTLNLLGYGTALQQTDPPGQGPTYLSFINMIILSLFSGLPCLAVLL